MACTHSAPDYLENVSCFHLIYLTGVIVEDLLFLILILAIETL
jgi:hypothetical protein